MTNANTDIAQQQSADMLALDMGRIHRSKTINPRRFRNKADFESLCESVKDQGVFQPIIVRPSPVEEGQFEIVAGDTRFEANKIAGHPTILAVIRNLNDAEAKEIAASENLRRSNLSEIEEAWIAADMMQAHHQDHEEVAKRLGWSDHKLKNRLLLSHCEDAVAEALTNETIKFGHAEVMANLTATQQLKVLERIVTSGMSVKEARERLRKINPLINFASFDTTACQTCRHNSASNADLFASSDEQTNATCYNLPCWEEKTEAAINIIATDAKENYGKVFRDTEISAGGHVRLEETGDNGVGSQQLNACASCEHYGAIIQTGYKKDGRLIPGTCFNLECHKEKVTAYQDIIKAVSVGNADQASGSTQESDTDKPRQGSKSNKGKGKKADSNPAAMRKTVKRVAFNRFSQASEHTIKQNPLSALAMANLAMIEKVRSDCSSSDYAKNQLDEILGRFYPDTKINSYGRLSSDAKLITALLEGGAEKMSPMLIEVSALMAYQNDIDQFEKSDGGKMNLALLSYFKTNVPEWTAVNEEYLNAQTKGAIIADCKASGFDAEYDQAHEKGAFSDLAKKKLTEIKEAILASDFDWFGYEPTGYKLTDYIAEEDKDSEPTEATAGEGSADQDSASTDESEAA